MRRLKRATAVLPLVVVLVGVIVPMALDHAENVRASDAESSVRRVEGRTAQEWAGAAMSELTAGRPRRAMSAIKTAESVEPGEQFSKELADIRQAVRRSDEVRELRQRFVSGTVEHLELRSDGTVASAQRLVTVLPGESLWTLAGDLAAAERRVQSADVTDRERYAAWDALTALNGVRELDVGEQVRVPVPASELVAMECANRRDLGLVAASSLALNEGDLDDAVRLRAELATAFAETTVSCRSLDNALSAAIAERDEMLALEHERQLMDRVHGALAEVARLPRATRHHDRLAALGAASEALAQAEASRDGVQYSDAAEVLSRLLSEERRFEVRSDGSLVATKSPGTSYTEAARQAVEWLLERELVWSGSSYPYESLKTDDERAWVRYLMAAAAAEGSGARFAAMLESVGEEEELSLPDPTVFFEGGAGGAAADHASR